MHFYYYYVEDTAEIRTCISYVVERNTAANTILPSLNCVTTKMVFVSVYVEVVLRFWKISLAAENHEILWSTTATIVEMMPKY